MSSCISDCKEVVSQGVTDANADDVTLPSTYYVGPWWVGETGYPDTIDIYVEAESGGGTDDLFMWLTTNVDQDNIGNYYGICKFLYLVRLCSAT